MLPQTTSKYLIYGLVDPTTNQLRYIGLSSSGLSRPKQHYNPYKLYRMDRKTNRYTPCQFWIQKLVKLGLNPEIVVIEECDSREALNEAEQFHISYYKSLGCELLNVQNGGYNYGRTKGWKLTEEQKLNMSKAQKKYAEENREKKVKIALQNIEKCKGKSYKWSEEQCLNLRSKSAELRGTKIQDNFGNTYNSVNEAVRKTGVANSSIYRSLKGFNLKSGYKFTLLDRST